LISISASSRERLNSKRISTLEKIAQNPINGNIEWRHFESIMTALGATVKKMSGSSRAFSYNGVRAIFHEPHGRKSMGRGMVARVQKFLIDAKVLVKDDTEAVEENAE